jgi:hypothetical protein
MITQPVSSPPDDRILGITRVVAALIIPFLVAAFVILYLLPDATDRLFAWTIMPQMSALLMGAGYASGIYFFSRVLRAPRWHWIGRAFLPLTVFVSFLELTTILHWERFHHGHIAFFAWTAIYTLTPIVLPILWLRNRGADPGTPDARDLIVPGALRALMALVGAVELALALYMFLLPASVVDLWPWMLTVPAARAIGGWFALHGAVGLALAGESRWSGMRIMLQTQMIALALILVAVVRVWSDFDTTNPLTWVFVIGTGFWLVVLAAIHTGLDARRKTAHHMAAAG